MKKSLSKVALLLVIILCAIMCLYACGKSDVSYTITVYNGDDVLASVKVAENATFDLSEVQIPSGYKLINLYTDKGLTTPFATDKAVAADMTLYAKLAKESNYIYVNSDGGSKVEKVEVTNGEAYEVPIPTKEGYDFKGFVRYDYEQEEDVPFAASGTYDLPGDARITATWTIQTYTVTFFDGEAVLDTKTVEYGKKLTLLTAPVKPGATFLGWFEAEATEKFADNSVITGNVTLSARYADNNYQITIVPNGGVSTAATVSATYGAAFPALPTVTKTGYSFDGWQKDGVKYDVPATYTETTGITLVAQWKAKTYTVTIDVNGGNELENASVTVTYGQAFPALPTVTKTGYSFDGWKKGGEKYDLPTTYTETNDDGITLVAQWTPKVYTLTVAGWDAATIARVTYGTTYTLVNPADDTDARYIAKVGDDEDHEWATFTGYTYKDQPFDYTGTYEYAESITVYPVKTDNIHFAKHKVTFTYGEYSKTIYISKSAEDKKIPVAEIPVAATGHTIGAWHEDTLEGELFDMESDITADVTLVATYSVNQYKITIEVNGGDALENASVTATYGQAFPGLPTVTKTGYSFDGWKKGGEKYDLPATYTETTGITLVAQWKKDIYHITLSLGGGLSAQTSWDISYGDEFPEIADPTRAGYDFDGWQKDSVDYDLPATYTETTDIILVAKWKIITYTITYINVDNGEVCDTQQVTYNTLYSFKELSRFGYGFISYATDDKGVNVVANTTNLTYTATEDAVYYVNWEDQTFIKDTVNKLFKEVEDGDDEYTYVFLTGQSYSWVGYELPGSSLYRLNEAKDTMTPVYPGEFTLTRTQYDGERNILNQVTIKAKIVYSIGTFGMGSDYMNMKAQASSSSVYQKAFEEETYVMSVGVSNYKPDISIRSDSYDTITFAQANVVLSVMDGETELDDSLVTTDGNAFYFNESLINNGNRVVTVNLYSKYDIKSTPTSLSIKLELNNGVNVYTNEELKAAYGNGSVHQINILRNIQAKLVASDYISGHGETYGDVTVFTDKDDQAGSSTVIPNVNLGAPINDFNHGVYTRVTTNQSDAIVINGNYFSIDGSKLPYINNSVDRYGAAGSSLTAGAGYRIANVQIGIFLYRCAQVDPADAGTIRAYKGGTATLSNLRIEGNNTYDQIALEDLHDGNSNHLLKMSAAYIGVVVRGGKMYMDNVSIRNTAMGFMLAGAVSGYDEPGVIDFQDGYQGKPQPGEEQATQLYADYLIVDNSWANSIYAWDLCIVDLAHSKIGQSSGAAIHVDDRMYAGSTTYDGKTAINKGLGFSDLQTKIVMDIDTAANINNWVTGEEAWFTAYGQRQTAGLVKSLVEGMINPGDAGPVTILKTVTIDGVKSSFMNFAILINEAGKGWSHDERLNDKQGGCSADLQTDTSTMNAAFKVFYGDDQKESANSGRPYVSADTTYLPPSELYPEGGDGSLTGQYKLLLPVYVKAELA